MGKGRCLIRDKPGYRRTAAEMSRLAREVMPLTFLLIGGKDAYPEVYKDVFDVTIL